MPRRCELGCSDKKNVKHQFPHPVKNPDRFKAWVHIVGGKLNSPADNELYKKKVICDIHFTDRDKNRNNRLNCLAVPSLHLLGKSDKVGTSEKVLLAPEPVIEESSLATLKPTLAIKSDEVGTSEKVLLAPEPVIEKSSLATLKPTLADKSSRNITSEHNYCQRQKKAINKKKSYHQQQELTSFLLNQLNTTSRKIKILQSHLTRSQKRNQTLQSRITNAEKMAADHLLNKLSSKMTTAAKIFTKMQYTQTKRSLLVEDSRWKKRCSHSPCIRRVRGATLS